MFLCFGVVKPTPDPIPTPDPTPTSNTIAKYYADVKTSTGVVKDITGINEATDEKPPFVALIVNSSELETLFNVISEEKIQGVNVWIKITDASTTMPAEDKEIINSKLGNDKLGMYLDATLFKKIGNNEPIRVTEVNGKIKISIVIPESLRKDGRSYSIVRVHNGVATEINGSYDSATYTFTFETDKFSSYAITYKDSASNNDQQIKSPKTGDEYNDKSWILLCLSIFVMAGCVYGNRKNRRVES